MEGTAGARPEVCENESCFWKELAVQERRQEGRENGSVEWAPENPQGPAALGSPGRPKAAEEPGRPLAPILEDWLWHLCKGRTRECRDIRSRQRQEEVPQEGL